LPIALAPGVPRSIVAKLNREIARILGEPETGQRWTPVGLNPLPTTPEAFGKLIRDDIAAFTRIARTANINAD